MEIVYLLVPLAVILALVAVYAFFWAVRSRQFDDLEGPAHRILMDDPIPPAKNVSTDRAHETGDNQGN